MYIPVFWEDRILEFPRRVSSESLGNGLFNWSPAPGEILKRGTQQSATNFGNMDFGCLENSLMASFAAINIRLAQESVDDMRGQVISVDLKNTLKFPATDAEKTITLPQMVNKVDYDVFAEIVSADGPVERVEVYGKALNAFKVCYSGSAKNVKVKLHVTGGLY